MLCDNSIMKKILDLSSSQERCHSYTNIQRRRGGAMEQDLLIDIISPSGQLLVLHPNHAFEN